MTPESGPRYERLLVHYAEIGTKGGNRAFFERRLAGNLGGALRPLGIAKFRREPGRLTGEIPEGADVEAILARGAGLPGVAWLAPAERVDATIEAIEEAAVRQAANHGDAVFRVETRRTDKRFPMDSLEVNRRVGARIVEASGRKVSLGAPEVTYGVEIDRDRAYVFSDRREGPGGLPVGSEGELVALISGGIDSPVAAYLMLLRGCRVRLVHFLNRSVSTNRVVEKVRDLAAKLALYHGPITLSVVPFEELQREIVMVVPDRYRMIVYRRAMFRIAERIRAAAGAFGFVTGDSVGQVASQTLENLRVIHDAADWPVYSPLAGMSKREITDRSKAIDTYEISIRPHEDCCSFMVAKHPETKARLEDVLGVEEKVRFEAGIEAALAGAEEILVRPA